MWNNIKEWFISNILWVCVIIALITGFLFYNYNQEQKIEAQDLVRIQALQLNDANKAKQDLAAQNAALAEDIKEIKQNEQHVNDIIIANSKLKRIQTIIEKEIDHVPVSQATTSSRPFDDPGMLRRADIMRDNQTSIYPK